MIIESYLLRFLTLPRIIAVFLLLVAVNLLAPFYSDDFFQQLLLVGDSLLQRQSDGSLLGLYSFFDSSPENRLQMQELGVLPWFAEEGFYFRFWRPLSELSFLLDNNLAPQNSVFAHAHSLLWMLALGVLFYYLAQQLFPQSRVTVLLATAIFFWDGQHVAVTHWIANRHALIAGFFVLAALLSFVRFRQSKKMGSFIAAIALYGLALLASESAVGLLPYVFFYLLLLDSSTNKQKAQALTPFIVLTLVWYAFYQYLGFGADTEQGLYLDPITDFPAFLLAVFERMPIYIVSLFLPIPAGFAWVFGMQWSVCFALLAWVFIAFIVYRVAPLLKQQPLVLFALFSAFASIIPACTSLPQDRLILLPTIGADLALAAIIVQLFALSWRLWAKLLLFIHLLLSPLHLLAGSVFMTFTAKEIEVKALALTADIEDKVVIALQMPIGEAVALMGTRHFHELPLAKTFYWLASDEQNLQIKPWDSRSFILEKEQGFGSGFEAAFGRHQRQPFYLDQVIYLQYMQIHIETLTSKGLPQRIRLIFPNGLNDKNMLFMTWENGQLQPLSHENFVQAEPLLLH